MSRDGRLVPRSVSQRVLRALDAVGIGGLARTVRRKARAAGFAHWEPLVPEEAFRRCLDATLGSLAEAAGGADRIGPYMEFGVSRGTSMAIAFEAYAARGLDGARFIGFDSFEGLPADADKEGWLPGDFHSTLPATRRYLRSRSVDLDRVDLVKGWFTETLSPAAGWAGRVGRPSVVLVDCDAYSSSKEALDFAGRVLPDVAVLILDDWGWSEASGHAGQKEAFTEFLAAHPYTAEPLPAYRDEARVFLLRRRDAGSAA